jgi:hypothetical protein
LQLNPTNATIEAGNTINFVATGGTTPYTFSIPTNNSGAVINPATGVYVAGGTFGVTDTVRVTDAANQFLNATVNVINPFQVTNTNSDGAGSLRRVIQNANSASGPQTITFNIPGTPPHTIALTQGLPNISDSVTIDGTTQPGFAGRPIIELNGAGAGGVAGLRLRANNITIKGLVINRFSSAGIDLFQVSGCVIQGNYIGTGVDGLTPLGNSNGVFISSADNNTIGGSAQFTQQNRNVISGNNFDGIRISNSDNNSISSNFIGVGFDGTSPAGNGGNGVRIDFGSDGNFVSGLNPFFRNTIAFSQGNGVLVVEGVRNVIGHNSIYSNGGLGIDLVGNDNPSGVTPNDPGDNDAGPNELQNFPVLTSATSLANGTRIQGTLNSKPNNIYDILVYRNNQCDQSGHGEGETTNEQASGQFGVTTDANGNATFDQTIPLATQAGQFVTAVAWERGVLNTSEFSACVAVTATCNFSITPTSQNFNSTGGNGTVAVNTAQTCQWNATSNSPFITIVSGSSGSGQGNVNFVVAPNTTGAQRTGTMTIAGQTFTVTQAANCEFSINPTAQNFSLTGGAGVVNVQTNPGCAWTAVSNNPFITIKSGGTGNGNGNVNYTVAASPDGNSRAGTMTIAGKTFTIAQSANNSSCSTPSFRITSSPITPSTSRVALSNDFNRDGILDLLSIENGSPSRVIISLSKGDGTFGLPIFTDLNNITAFAGIAAGDLNNDGLPDLALRVTNSTTQVSEIRIALGNGAGGFNFSTPLPMTSALISNQVVIGDFNNDGKQDLVTNKNSNQFLFFLGNGDGTFAAPLDRTGGLGFSLIATDFNRDGKLDFISTDLNRADVFLGNGNGDFSISATLQPNDSFGPPTVEDFNRDGKPDIAISDRTSSPNVTTIKILLGNGTGGFGSPVSLQSVNGIGNPLAGDFNRDGKLDLVHAATIPSTFAIFSGDGAGNFSMPLSNFNVPISGGHVVGDFNLDGKTDIAVNSGIQGTTIMLNSCGGLTLKPKIDFDGDGKTDIAVFRPSDGTWYVLRSSDGTFQGVQFGQSGDKPSAGDFDGDGKTDFAVFRPSNGTWFILKSSDGAVIITQWGVSEDQPAVGDYDGDGKADIAVFRPSVGNWFVLKSSDGQSIILSWGIASDIVIQ